MRTVEPWLVNNLWTQEACAGDGSPKPISAEQVLTTLEVHAPRAENGFYPAYETMTGKHGPQLVADSCLVHEQGKARWIELQSPDLDEEACEATGQELRRTVEQHGRPENRWRVFRNAHTAHLGHRRDQGGRPRVGTVSKIRGLPRPRVGWNAHDHAMFCSCTRALCELHRCAFSPYVSRG